MKKKIRITIIRMQITALRIIRMILKLAGYLIRDRKEG